MSREAVAVHATGGLGPMPGRAVHDRIRIPRSYPGVMDDEPFVSDAAWTEKIRQGDQGAFGALFRAYYPRLCGFVARRTGSREVAEELVQEVFLAVWERRVTLDPERPIDRYLYRAARNRVLNHLKRLRLEDRSRPRVIAAVRTHQEGPDEELRYSEISAAARRAVDGLPPRCRHVFLLSREGELTYAQIAELLEISVKTVETQMGRALKALRSALSSYLA